MQMTLNGDPHVVADGTIVASLLVEQIDLAGTHLAVEVNGKVESRRRRASASSPLRGTFV